MTALHDTPRTPLRVPPVGDSDGDRTLIADELHALNGEAQLAQARREGQIGSWSWDTATGRVSWSAEMYRIYGLDPKTFDASFEGFLGRLHDDDRDRVRDLVEAACRSGGTLDYEHRIVRPDGEVRTLRGRGTVVIGDGGLPVRMSGTGQDITGRTSSASRGRRVRSTSTSASCAAAMRSSSS